MNPYQYQAPPLGIEHALRPLKMKLTVKALGGNSSSFGKHRTITQLFYIVFGLVIGYVLTSTIRHLMLNPHICFFKQKIPVYDDLNDAFRTIKHERTKDAHNSAENLVFVGVMTANMYLNTRAKAVYETWGKQLPGKIAFFTSEDSVSSGDLPVIRLEGVDDSYPPQKKSFMMIKYMAEHFAQHFEYFIRADDDVYMRTDRLERFLRSINSTNLHFIGQAGKGNQEEFGHLSLKDDENFCMGGPGIIMSRSTLLKVAPHVRHCLKNLRSTHEDVEVGRCVRKYAEVPCTWSYEMQSILYHNSSGTEAFSGSLKQREVHRAITLHPIKNHVHLYRLHTYIQGLEIRAGEAKLVHLVRELAKTSEEMRLSTPNLNEPTSGDFLDHLGMEITLQKWNPALENEVLPWDFISRAAFHLGDANPRHKPTSGIDEGLQDVIRDVMDIINRVSKERGRIIDFKEILYGYMRWNPTFALEYILDMLLLYKKYRGKKMTVSVRRHAYIQVPFGPLKIQEYESASEERDESNSTLGLQNIVKAVMKNSLRDIENLQYQVPQQETVSKRQPKRINFILPLSGRFTSFQRFMDDFRRICLEGKENVRLLVILFPSSNPKDDTSENVEALISSLQLDYPLTPMSVIETNRSFARALALEMGASQCMDSDLMLFVDVDMTFTSASLDRIRLHTIKGQQVYYPVVFSEFDPSTSGASTHAVDHTLIDEEVGYWRAFGFGIVAIYKSDLHLAGGLDTTILGWGREDVDLFEKVIKSDLQIFRAADPGLIHVFHHVECAKNLVASQYEMCQGSLYSTYSAAHTLTKTILENPEILKDI